MGSGSGEESEKCASMFLRLFSRVVNNPVRRRENMEIYERK